MIVDLRAAIKADLAECQREADQAAEQYRKCHGSEIAKWRDTERYWGAQCDALRRTLERMEGEDE